MPKNDTVLQLHYSHKAVCRLQLLTLITGHVRLAATVSLKQFCYDSSPKEFKGFKCYKARVTSAELAPQWPRAQTTRLSMDSHVESLLFSFNSS